MCGQAPGCIGVIPGMPRSFQGCLSNPDSDVRSLCGGCAGGLRLWTHFDVMDNLLCQIRGTKRVRLWPPLEVRAHSQPDLLLFILPSLRVFRDCMVE